MTFQLLSDVATVISGQHIESTLYSRAIGGTPYLTGPADFTARHPCVSKWTNAPKVLARASDVLVTVKGAGVGKVNWGCDAAIGRQLMAVRPMVGSLEQSYLFHFMKSQEQTLSGLAQGATVPGIGRDDLLKLTIPIPSLSVQQTIAGILDKADALRVRRRAAHAQLDALTQSIFLDMFGDPVTNPKGWNIRSLSEIGIEFRYGTSNKSAADGKWTLRIPNVVDRSVNLNDLKRVPITVDDLERLRLRRGDLLFVRTNGNPDYVGRCAVYDPKHVQDAGFDGDDFIFASYLIRGRIPDNALSPVFLREYLSSPEGLRGLRSRSKTSAGQYNLNTEGLRTIRTIVPPRELQEAFARRIDKIEIVRRSTESASAKHDVLFASLQHRAFRGEL